MLCFHLDSDVFQLLRGNNEWNISDFINIFLGLIFPLLSFMFSYSYLEMKSLLTY
jgi:hypothetical protein